MIRYNFKIFNSYNVFFLFFKIKLKKSKLEDFEESFKFEVEYLSFAACLFYFKKETSNHFVIKMFLGIFNFFSLKATILSRFQDFIYCYNETTRKFSNPSTKFFKLKTLKVLKNKNLSKMFLKINKNYSLKYYCLNGFTDNMELITECLNLKKISVGRDFKLEKEFVITGISNIRKSRIKKDKFYLYYILMRDFFLHRFAYQDFHDFLWLKFDNSLSSSFSSQLISIRTRLFEDLKINFKNYMKKIEKFFYTKLDFMYDEVEYIIFFI